MLQIAKFLGLVNTIDPLTAPTGSLAVADNIDIDSSKEKSGSIHRRSGYTQIAALTDVQSAYATEDQKRLYIIANGELLSYNEDMTNLLLGSGFPDGEYYWEEVGEKLYFNGPMSGVITNGQYQTWGVPAASPPTVTRIAGSLPAGRYMFSCVFRSTWGEEGGAAPSTVLEVPANSAFSINVPQLANHVAVIYMTTNNGDQLYKITESFESSIIFDGPLDSLTYPMAMHQYQTQQVPETTYNLAHYESRMYATEYDQNNDVSFIYKSQIFWLGLFDLFADYIQMPGQVRLLVSYKDGLVIGTDREIYNYNSAQGATLLADYGVPKGYQATKSPVGIVYFWTNRGLCRVPDFANITEARFSTAPGDRCNTAFIEQDGYNKVIVSTTDSGTENNKYS